MTAVWVTSNFVLVVLAFYLILHLYQRIRVLEQIKTDRILSDIEEVFSAYLEDVRKENDRLASEVRMMIKKDDVLGRKAVARETKEEGPPETKGFDQVLNEEVTESHGRQKQFLQPDGAVSQGKDGNADRWAPPVDGIQDTLEESPLVQALKLEKKGYTVIEIAKKMNRGQSEIELLLKFKGKVRR